MEIEKTETVKVNAKYLKLHLKVTDQFYASLESFTGTCLKDYEGYVPDFMPGDHFGDYVYLTIDIDTGEIVNWSMPTATQIENFIKGEG